MTEKNKGGRPSDYKEKYCEMLFDHMSKGYSFRSFGGKLRISEQTLHTWCKKHPAFLESKKAGYEAGLFKYEQMCLGHITGSIQGSTSALVWFGKNCYGWKDKSEVEQSSKIEINISESDQEL